MGHVYHKLKNNSQHSGQIYSGKLKEHQLFKLILLYSYAKSRCEVFVSTLSQKRTLVCDLRSLVSSHNITYLLTYLLHGAESFLRT